MDLLSSCAASEIDKQSDQLYTLSRAVWRLAEQGGREKSSCARIVKFLRKRQFKVTTNFLNKPTAFLAEYGGGPSGIHHKTDRRPSVLLISQYDAVKGKGHVLGNNLVATVAAAAAIGIQDAIDSSHHFGKVTVVGCPNSQAGWLLQMMDEEGFRGFDVCLTAAPGPRTEWAPRYTSCKTLRAIYRDQVTDLCGQDLVPKKERFLRTTTSSVLMAHTNVHVVREHCHGPGWKLSGSIPQGGTSMKFQPLPDSESVFKFEAPSDVEVRMMEKRLLPCLEAAAHASGCPVEVGHNGFRYYSLMHCPTLVEQLKTCAYHCGVLGTPLKDAEDLPPTDVAGLCHAMPTLRPMFYIGCDHKVGTKAFKDHCGSRQAHAHTMAMGKALALTAIEVMRTPGLLDTVCEELQEERERQKRFKFEPFPTQQTRKYQVPKQVPVECNIGWSKR